MAHDKCARLLCLFLDRLGGLAGLLGCACGIPGSLTSALGGSVFLFDGLFLLPAGNGVAGKLGIFPQGLLIQGVYIGLFQLLLGLGCLAVGLQFVAAVAFPHQPCAGLGSLLGLVGALNAHIVLFGLPDFLVNFPQGGIGGGIPHRMGQLGGRLLLVLQHQFGGHFTGLRVYHLLPDLLFGNFSLRLIRFGGGLVHLADGLLQRRVSPFLVCKAQARFLIQTIHPA